MIAGYSAMRDQLDLDPRPTWHLVDVSTYPLYALCGRRAPAAMQRDVKPAGQVPVDDACGRCLSAAARGGVLVERRLGQRGPGSVGGGIAVAVLAPLTATAWIVAEAGGRLAAIASAVIA
jgi:hypothetical protein